MSNYLYDPLLLLLTMCDIDLIKNHTDTDFYKNMSIFD